MRQVCRGWVGEGKRGLEQKQKQGGRVRRIDKVACFRRQIKPCASAVSAGSCMSTKLCRPSEQALRRDMYLSWRVDGGHGCGALVTGAQACRCHFGRAMDRDGPARRLSRARSAIVQIVVLRSWSSGAQLSGWMQSGEKMVLRRRTRPASQTWPAAS